MLVYKFATFIKNGYVFLFFAKQFMNNNLHDKKIKYKLNEIECDLSSLESDTISFTVKSTQYTLDMISIISGLLEINCYQAAV